MLSCDDADYSNKADLHLLEQMGIYPEPAIRQKRPTLKAVALSFIAIARMRLVLLFLVNDRRLKDDWAEHKKGGKELKDSLRRLKVRKAIVV